MKKILIILTVYLVSLPCIAETIHTYDKYGSQTGTIRDFSNGYQVYDDKGKMQGTFRKYDNGNAVYTDSYGNNQRTYMPSPNGDRIHVSDKYGKPVGTIVPTDDGGFNTYDSHGASTGSFRSYSDGMYGTMYDSHGNSTGSFRSY